MGSLARTLGRAADMVAVSMADDHGVDVRHADTDVGQTLLEEPDFWSIRARAVAGVDENAAVADLHQQARERELDVALGIQRDVWLPLFRRGVFKNVGR